jgi:putative membrane protein
MIGWLGATYPWVKAAHVIFVIFLVSGLFMLPRHLLYHRQTEPGSAEDLLWIAREAKLMRMIVNPSLIAVWVLGLVLAFNIGFDQGWLHAKLLLVVLLSAYHGWLSGLRKRFARGERPLSVRTIQVINEVPGIATVLIVVLAVAKPF